MVHKDLSNIWAPGVVPSLHRLEVTWYIQYMTSGYHYTVIRRLSCTVTQICCNIVQGHHIYQTPPVSKVEGVKCINSVTQIWLMKLYL